MKERGKGKDKEAGRKRKEEVMEKEEGKSLERIEEWNKSIKGDSEVSVQHRITYTEAALSTSCQRNC